MQHCDGAYPGWGNWRTKDYKHCIRDSEMECTVVEAGGMFAGYMITERYVNTLEIWRLSVDPMLLRCGIGTRLVSSLQSRLLEFRSGKNGLRTLLADVDEDNLRAQQFFRSVGFRAKLPLVSDEDGSVFYRFTYDLFGGTCAGT